MIAFELSSIAECQVRLYGSSLSGFGFKESNVNLDIQMAPDVSPATILLGTDKAMHKHSGKPKSFVKYYTKPEISLVNILKGENSKFRL